MNPPITMQYHLLPGGGGAHPAAFQPLPRENAHANDTTAAQQPSRNNSSKSADENKNLGQRPPNAGLFIFCIPWVQVS